MLLCEDLGVCLIDKMGQGVFVLVKPSSEVGLFTYDTHYLESLQYK